MHIHTHTHIQAHTHFNHPVFMGSTQAKAWIHHKMTLSIKSDVDMTISYQITTFLLLTHYVAL